MRAFLLAMLIGSTCEPPEPLHTYLVNCADAENGDALDRWPYDTDGPWCGCLDETHEDMSGCCLESSTCAAGERRL